MGEGVDGRVWMGGCGWGGCGWEGVDGDVRSYSPWFQPKLSRQHLLLSLPNRSPVQAHTREGKGGREGRGGREGGREGGEGRRKKADIIIIGRANASLLLLPMTISALETLGLTCWQ